MTGSRTGGCCDELGSVEHIVAAREIAAIVGDVCQCKIGGVDSHTLGSDRIVIFPGEIGSIVFGSVRPSQGHIHRIHGNRIWVCHPIRGETEKLSSQRPRIAGFERRIRNTDIIEQNSVTVGTIVAESHLYTFVLIFSKIYCKRLQVSRFKIEQIIERQV